MCSLTGECIKQRNSDDMITVNSKHWDYINNTDINTFIFQPQSSLSALILVMLLQCWDQCTPSPVSSLEQRGSQTTIRPTNGSKMVWWWLFRKCRLFPSLLSPSLMLEATHVQLFSHPISSMVLSAAILIHLM